MKRTFKGFLVLSFVFLITVAHAAVGDLVSTFGTAGVVTTNFGTESAEDVAMGVVADPASLKVIVVGSTTTTLGDTDFAVARFDSTTGELDTSFGTDGYVITDFGSYEDDLAYAVAVDSQSRIIVVGSTGSSDNQDIAIARYDSDGNLDTTFGGGDGLVIFNTQYDLGDDYNEYAVDVLIDSSDNIIVGSNFLDNSGPSSYLGLAVSRFEGTDGDPDTTFNSYGYKVVDFTPFDGPVVLRDILLDGSGRVLATGCVSCDSTSSDSFLVRLTTAGALDTAFSGDGIYTVDITGSTLEDGAYKIAMGSSGKIYMVGGADNTSSLMDFFVERLTSLGTRDMAFGTRGIVTTDFAAVFGVPTDEVAVNVKHNSTTGTTVLGYAGSSGAYTLLAVRYNSSGVLDNTFDGGDGLMSSDITGLTGEAFDYANATAFKGNVGYFVAGSNSDDDFITSLLDTTFTPSTSFDTDGIATADFPKSSSETINSLAQDSSGNIYAAGCKKESGISYCDFALARYTSAGVLDSSFGSNGLVTTSVVTSGTDTAKTVLLDSSNRPLLLGYSANSGTSYDFTLARYTTAGILDTSFGTNGTVVQDLGTSRNDTLYAGTLTSDDKIILVGVTDNESTTGDDVSLAKYDPSTNAFDTSFGGGDGLLTLDVLSASQNDYASAIILDSSERILVAGSTNDSSGQSVFLLLRLTSTGELDTTFGDSANGIVTTDVSVSDSDKAYALALQSDGKVLVAGCSRSSALEVSLDLVRYTTAGALDGDFDDDGMVTVAVGTAVDSTNDLCPKSVSVSSSGKIIVVANDFNADGLTRFTAYRFNSDGSQDTNFMTVTDQPVTFDIDDSGLLNDLAQAALIHSNGDLVMGGSTDSGTTFALAAVTLQACGDGEINGSEECDDGNTAEDDHCNNSCYSLTLYYPDSDADGYGSTNADDAVVTISTDSRVTSGSYIADATDCNDSDAAINTGATETCNSIDDNCDGTVDESSTEVCGDGIDQDCDGSDTPCSVTVAPAALDSDGDGVLDPDDAFPNDAAESVDTDDDGVGDNADTDDDGDGIEDSTVVAPAALDSDGDGVLDPDDAFPNDAAESVDTDDDGIGDNADTDDDNDGIADSTAVAPAALDSDGDGVLDPDDAFPSDATESVDTDGDGVGDNTDTDDDNDGVVDSADPDQMDSDADGTVDSADPDQMDSDGDGVVDAADALPTDADNDGIDDASDPDVIDTDADGVVDAEDTDDDADGLEDDVDDDDDGDGTTDVDESASADAAGTAKSTGCGCSFAPNHGNTTTQNALMGFLVFMTGAILGMMRRYKCVRKRNH